MAGQSLWKELEAASHIHSSEGRESLLSATFGKKSRDSNSAVGVPSVSPALWQGCFVPVFLFEGSLWPCVHIWSLQCQALEPRLDLTRQMMEFEEQYFNLLSSKETVLTCVPQSQEGSLVSLVSNSTHSAAFTSFLPHLVQSHATL